MNLTDRGGPSAAPRPVRLVMPFLIFMCFGLLLLSRLNHSALNDARWQLAAWLSPALEAAIIPFAPLRNLTQRVADQMTLNDEISRLRVENAKLSSWEWRARDVERRLLDLEALARVVQDSQLQFVTARVLSDSSGAFVRTVMINAGEKQNVKPGHPVINAEGLVGRIVETGPDTSRVLLASDLLSRIPVVIGRTGVRAILAGDNGPEPRLTYLAAGADIAVGDDVATSGTGGLFPPGLRIGKVTGDLAAPRVSLRADLDQLQYISVLFYEDPALGLLGGNRREKANGDQASSERDRR